MPSRPRSRGRQRRAGQPAGAVVLGGDFKALAVVRSLSRLGVPCVVVDDLAQACWFSRRVAGRHRSRGPMLGDGFSDFLVDLAGREGLGGWLLFPTQDDAVETVARNRATLDGVYRIVTPAWPELSRLHDKRLLHALADQTGVAHPRTWYPRGRGEVTRMAIEYPAIVKPTMSIGMQHRTGRKALPAADPAALLAQYDVAAAATAAETLMVQELIPGHGAQQHSVAAFCERGRLVAAMTARRTRQFPRDFGLGSSFVEAVEVPGLIDLAARLLEPTGVSGMLEVEFKLDPRDGVHKLLDVNVRPWGWHSLCIASGLDFPAMQYRMAMGEELRPASPRYGRRWLRLVTDVPAAMQEVRAGTLTPAGYLRSLRGPLVLAVFDPTDPLPWFGDAASAAYRRLRTRRGGASAPADERMALHVVGPESTVRRAS